MRTALWRAVAGISVGLMALTGCSGRISTNLPAETTKSPALRGPDGGSDYYGRFEDSLPTEDSFFPVGVWLESITDAADLKQDAEVGINTYVDVTTDSNSDLLSDADAQILASWDAPASRGSVLADEVDMWAGPGSAEWTGAWPGQDSICTPAHGKCGYTVQGQLAGLLPEGTLSYANYGKGVTFWESDEQAARFVNDYQDIVSADNYWFTDPNICVESEGGTLLKEPRELKTSECRRASNYGWTVERLRSLVSPLGTKPVWSFVEVGHPSTEPDAPTITGPQIRAAVWSSIIHGARGIIYFNHSFAGSCPSHHVLRDCGNNLRAEVAALNQQVFLLAPVLNSPFLDGALASSPDIDAAVKVHSGDLYVLAGTTGSAAPQATFSLQCTRDGDAEVVGEDRSVTVRNGRFTDSFAGADDVHIYKLSGNTCGF